MKKTALLIFIFLGFISPLALFISCSSSQDYSSKWANEPVPTDGSGDNWKNKTTYFKDGSLLLGVQNDGQYLYLALTTSDRQSKMQILMQGLEVWFDPTGGNNKTIGIKYPIGARESGLSNLHRNENETGTDNNNQPGNNWADQLTEYAINSTTLEILGPGEDDKNKMELKDASGIELKLGSANDVLIYEMKIALRPDSSNTYSIGLGKNPGIIGLGVETEEFKRPENSNNSRGEKGEFGNQHGNRGHGRGRGNFQRGNQEMPAPLKFWFNLKLASGK